jgi:hypothetical protein
MFNVGMRMGDIQVGVRYLEVHFVGYLKEFRKTSSREFLFGESVMDAETDYIGGCLELQLLQNP